MSGTLYIVGTPIGNLGDITFRAVETLKNVDVIACEDTRHTLRLLNYLSIKKPLISYYKQKEKEGSQDILRLLDEGKNVALVSDAGMPCISDPGAVICQKARENGFFATVIPGPTALTSAVALCGIETGFTFIGFLPEKKKECDEYIKNFVHSPLPLVFYVAPHDIEKTIIRLHESLGERKYYAVKELTKVFEGVTEGTLGKDIEFEAKGEFVLVVFPESKEKEISGDEDILSALKEEISSGSDKKTAVKTISERMGVPKNRVYKLSLSL